MFDIFSKDKSLLGVIRGAREQKPHFTEVGGRLALSLGMPHGVISAFLDSKRYSEVCARAFPRSRVEQDDTYIPRRTFSFTRGKFSFGYGPPNFKWREEGRWCTTHFSSAGGLGDEILDSEETIVHRDQRIDATFLNEAPLCYR